MQSTSGASGKSSFILFFKSLIMWAGFDMPKLKLSKAVESDAMVDFMDDHWADEIQAYKEGKNGERC